MKSATSTTWLLGLVLGFILLFTAYIILTINYSKTVRIKNEMISMVEKYEGLNTNSIQLVNNYLASINYNMKGECTDDNNSGVYGADNLQATSLVEAQPGEKYYYCVKKYKGVGTTRYYQVAIFYKFNLPVVGATGNFAVRGVTGNFQSRDEAIYAKNVDGSFDTTKPSGGGGSTTTPPSLSSKYTVSFNLNGGSGSIPAQTVEYGTPASEPPKPTREGYTFISWQLNGNEYNFAQPVRSNITLRARWLKNSIAGSVDTGGSTTGGNTYTVSFNLNGGTAQRKNGNGTIITPIPSQNVVSGGRVSRPADPYKYSPSSTFVRWELNGAPYDFNTPVTSNITLTATWRETARIFLQIPPNSSCVGENRVSDGRVYKFSNHFFEVDSNFRLTLGTFKLYEGPSYGSNFGNNAYDWTYEIGIGKPITRWVNIKDGTTWDISKPVTDDLHLNAMCD